MLTRSRRPERSVPDVGSVALQEASGVPTTSSQWPATLDGATVVFTAMRNLPLPSVVAFATSRSAPSSVHNSCTTARKEEREGDRGEGIRKRGEEIGEWIRRERSEVVGQ